MFLENINFITYLFPFFSAILLSVVFTLLIRKIALKLKIVSKPTSEPKILHKKSTPLLGGIAVFLSFSILIIFYLVFTDKLSGGILFKNLLGVMIGGLVLMIGGYLDDKYNLKPSKQIIFPIVASLIVIISGIGISYIRNPFGDLILLDQLKMSITFFGTTYYIAILASIFIFLWLIGMMYTTKYLDGVDGLSSGVTTIAAIVLFFLSLSPDVNQPYTALICAILAGAVLGFLPFNFYPAKIFAGEGGSVFFGFAIGALAIISGGKIATALLIMGIPILDVAWVILRRIVKRKSPFKADRFHLHHRLLDIGLSQRQTVIFLYVLTLFFGLVALSLQTQGKLIALIILLIVMAMLGIFLVLGYKYKKNSYK